MTRSLFLFSFGAIVSELVTRLRDWWTYGFGWCRFLGHDYSPDDGWCLRCGGIPASVWEGDGHDD